MRSAIKNDKLAVAAAAAAATARALLNAAEDLPYFGTVAKLINKLVAICDQCKCNKEAASALQVRFCRLADHLFGGDFGLAVVAQNRPNNNTIITFIGRMESILNEGINEISKFTKGGFIQSILKGSKPQKTFESLDQDMTLCLNELSVALQTTQLHEQAQMYNVVCNIQDKIDQRGGLEGLLADPAQLQWLATEIGADVSDLQVEVSSALAALSSQGSVVDENVRKIDTKVDELTHLLRKAVECARLGDDAAPLTPSHSLALECVYAALSIINGAVTPTFSFASSNKLRFLSCEQVCDLFDHCHIAEFKTFLVKNEFKGARKIFTLRLMIDDISNTNP